MYAVVLRFQILDPATVPSAEVLRETIFRMAQPNARARHVAVERTRAHQMAVLFVAATGPDEALALGWRAAGEVEFSTAALRGESVDLLRGPPHPE